MANNILGIIGRGIVGKATDYAFYNNAIILDPAINENTISDLLGCDIIFICVPTPKGDDEHFKDYMKQLHAKMTLGLPSSSGGGANTTTSRDTHLEMV